MNEPVTQDASPMAAFGEVNEAIYSQLKARYMADPDSLAPREKEALALAATVRLALAKGVVAEREETAKQMVWDAIAAADGLLARYQGGEYKGSDFEEEFEAIFPSHKLEALAVRFGDNGALGMIYQIDHRFLQITRPEAFQAKAGPVHEEVA